MQMLNLILYIDPGTGSMLFAVLIGIFGALGYIIRMAWVEIRFRITSGKKEEVENSKIPYVVFADDKRYWPVFEPVLAEFDRRGIDVKYLTASKDDPGLNCRYEHVKSEFLGEGNKAFSKLNFLNACVVLSTTPGLDVYQWKRSRDVDFYVHIPHSAGEIALYRMFGIDYYDSILIAGEHLLRHVRELETLRNLPEKEVVYAGLPYMDKMVERLQNNPEVKEHETTVLLAPSWGPSSLLNKFGEKIIDHLIATGYTIIIRPHPQSFTSEKEMIERLQMKYPESQKLKWNRDVDNFEVLKNSDILISDFSAVVFDFALVYDKPIIYTDTKFERDTYDYWWMDDEVWTLTALPKLGEEINEENMKDVKEIIYRCLSSGKYAEGRDEVRNECWQCYGEGAVKTVDYLTEKYKMLSESETGSPEMASEAIL